MSILVCSSTPNPSSRMALPLLDLPSDMLIEILSRLPLTSLFISRLVCKTFVRLTPPNNPHFTALHSTLIAHHRIRHDAFYLMEPQLDVTVGLSESFDSDSHDGRIENSVAHLPGFLPEGKYYTVANACNGLLYINEYRINSKESFVCNPITRECHTFPDPTLLRGGWNRNLVRWLGYSRGNNRYKVMNLVRTSAPGEVLVLEAKVLDDFGSNSWRDVKVTPAFYDHYLRPRLRHSLYPLIYACYAHVDCTVYWGFELLEDDIYFFNFEKEVFGVIGKPKSDRYPTMDCFKRVGLLHGRLCFCYSYPSVGQKVLWVLEKTAEVDTGTWRKRHVVEVVEGVHWRFSWEIRFTKELFHEDALMITPGSKVVCYNPEDRSSRTVIYQAMRTGYKRQTRFFEIIPSFIPLRDALKVRQRTSDDSKQMQVADIGP